MVTPIRYTQTFYIRIRDDEPSLWETEFTIFLDRLCGFIEPFPSAKSLTVGLVNLSANISEGTVYVMLSAVGQPSISQAQSKMVKIFEFCTEGLNLDLNISPSEMMVESND